MKTVIMAGGKGTRISSIASDIPKPMIRINDKPVLQLEIESLKRQGFNDFIITISHLGYVIQEYFGDGLKFGVNIEYFNEEKPLGNAGALFELKEKLTEDFLLINGDVLFEFDANRFVRYHKEKGGLVTLFTHPNSHPYDSGLILTDKDNLVYQWLNKEDDRPLYYKNRVNAGIHILSPEVLKERPDKEKVDLDRDVLKPLCSKECMYAYDSTEYVKDMGTPERYVQVCEDLLNGKVERRSLSNKQKAIFLDRDGTINTYVGFLRDIDKFELTDTAAQAIRMINDSEYLAIVVTNQPVIARGEVSFEELDEIHKKMETLLGKQGAYIDGLYFCPHHPHSGFEGEIRELKIDCDCRKPKPGMLLKAAEDFNIDLSHSFMIGDSDNDMAAGSAAGCKCIRIDRDGNLVNAVKQALDR
nr:HAD-IIIA family hydrolase [Clostridia bacterium]